MSDERTSPKDVGVFSHASLGTELVDIGKDSFFGKAVKGVDELGRSRGFMTGAESDGPVVMLSVVGVLALGESLVFNVHLVFVGEWEEWVLTIRSREAIYLSAGRNFAALSRNLDQKERLLPITYQVPGKRRSQIINTVIQTPTALPPRSSIQVPKLGLAIDAALVRAGALLCH